MEPGYTLLRYSLGIVYFHFGILKFFRDLSPAEMMVELTIMKSSFYFINAHNALLLLAVLEVIVGLGFLFNFKPRWIFYVFLYIAAGWAVLYPQIKNPKKTGETGKP